MRTHNKTAKENKVQLIIGDKFSSFAKVSGALTRVDAVQALLSRSLTTPVVLGQGLSDDDQKLLTLLSEAHGLEVVPLTSGRSRADRSITHKHIPANSLITTPVAVEDQILEADILIDDKNEIMSDHLTGCHVQGMVLIEAIRQMFVAAAQLHEATKASVCDAAVVIQKIDISFENFAFPIATIIRHKTLAVDTTQKDRIAFKALLEIAQNGKRCVVAEVDYLVLEASAFEPRETLKAKRCAQTYLRATTVETANAAVVSAA